MISHDESNISSAESSEEREYLVQHSPAYSSRFMTKGLPKHSLPDGSSSPSEAYQIVSDCISLDRNPTQNMATFVTSWIENKGEHLMRMTMNKNMADLVQYPQINDIQNRCLSIIANLFNSKHSDDHSIGVPTIGSSEAAMLGCLSLKFNWRDRMKSKGKPCDKPNIIFGKNSHVCFEKFARYFDVEARTVPISKETNYCLSVDRALKMVDENTIGIVGILGSTYTGHFEPIEELNQAVEKLYQEKGLYIPIHVDAASGGFIAPFLHKDLLWDFRLKWVKSINVSSHKFGLVPPGLGWCVWRSKDDLNNNLIFHLEYLGGISDTFCLNFSKSSSPIFAQYYNFVRLGRQGYTKILSNCSKNAKYLAEKLSNSSYFDVISDVYNGLPLIAFKLSNNFKAAGKNTINEYDVSKNLLKKGWQVPAYRLPPDNQDIVIMRVVVREMHSEDLMQKLYDDIIWALEDLLQEKSKTTTTRKREEEKKTSVFRHPVC